MLKLKNLDEEEFQDILNDLMRKIPIYAPSWTNKQASDPGVVILEMMAWLDVIMHKYMSVIPDELYSSLIKLLNIVPLKNRGSKAVLSISEIEKDICIPRNTKWYHDKLVFENSQAVYLAAGKISALLFYRDNKHTKIEFETFKLSNGISLFGNNDKVGKLKDNYFSIFLTKHPKQGEWINFHIELEKDEERVEGKSLFPMSKIKWEYMGEDGEYHTFSDVLQQDALHGMLSLKISQPLGELEGEYIIRAKVEWEEYDICPRVKSINLNSFEVVQKNTLCENELIVGKDIINGEFETNHYLAIHGKNELYLLDKEGLFFPSEYTVLKDYDSGTAKVKIEHYNGNDVLFVMYDAKIENKILIGSTTQLINQSYELDFDNILEDELELIIKMPSGGYRKWYLDDNFSRPRTFRYDSKKRVIKFGDNIQGYAPLKAENSIRICRLAITYGGQSNIKEGTRKESKLIPNLIVTQLTAAAHGRDKDTIEDLKRKAGNLLSGSKKAVTIEDYESIVKKTPALIIEKVKVVNIQEKKHMIVVKGAGRAATYPLEAYRKSIIENLEKYRLIGTKIEVVWPVNIDIAIDTEIIVSSYYRESNLMITKFIERFIKDKEIGSILSFSELYGKIEMLSCVERIVSLNIVANTNEITKTLTNDMVIPQNSIYRIDKLNINLIKSNTI